MTETIKLRIAGVLAEVSLDGCDHDVAAAVRIASLPTAVSVPATPDVTIGLSGSSNVAEVLADLRRDLSVEISAAHDRLGWIQFGAHALVNPRGAAVVVIAVGSVDVGAALADLVPDLEVLDPGRWLSDPSGAIVRGGTSHDLLDGLPPSAQSSSARLRGVVILRSAGSGTNAASSDGDRIDGVCTLAQHTIAHGVVGERARLLRAVQAIAAGQVGIRLLRVEDLPAVRELIDAWSADLARTTSPAPPFALSFREVTAAAGGWFRGPAHDYLERQDDVIIARRLPDGLELVVMSEEAGILWRHADGLPRDDLIAASVSEAEGRFDLAAFEAAFDNLQQDGTLVEEPSWAIAPHVAWSESLTQTVVLNTIVGDPQPIALEGSARAVWDELVVSPHISLTEIVARSARHFEIDPVTIHPDVESLVDDLRRRGLIGWV